MLNLRQLFLCSFTETFFEKGNEHMLGADRFLVYGSTAYHELDAEVLALVNQVTGLNLAFAKVWHHFWPDEEPGFRFADHEPIKGRHVIIFACPITNKYELELRDLVTACKQQYGARSVTVVFSFMRYRRQDRSELHHEITRLRWFLSDLKHWGTDHLVVCEPHSVKHTQKYCDEFGLKLYVCDPTMLFFQAIRGVVQTLGGPERVRIYSPDFGSVSRAIALAKPIDTKVIATPKRRVNGRIISLEDSDFLRIVQEEFGSDAPVSCDVKNLNGFHVIIREDELDSAGTAVTTAHRLRQNNAASVRLVVTHGVCSRGWKMRMFPYGEPQPFDGIWMGNTRPRGTYETQYEGSTGGKVTDIDLAPVIAETLISVLRQLED